MALAQKTIGNTSYYTDGVNYFTFHVVSSRPEPLYIFACRDLGITKTSGFTPDETARINDLAGTSLQQQTKYQVLKNGVAMPVPYLATGKADLKAGDILLRRVPAPAAGLVKCPHCASTVPPGPVCSACGKQLT